MISGQIDERQFDAAVDRSATHVLLARAYAESQGEAVEVRFDEEKHAWTSRRFSADGGVPARTRADDDPLGLDETAVPAGAFADDIEDERDIVEPWAFEPLPRGVRASFEAPVPIEDLDADPAAPPRFEIPEDEWGAYGGFESDAPRRVVVLLPDGTALLRRSMWLVGVDGRAVELSVNPWSGVMVATAVTVEEDTAPDLLDTSDGAPASGGTTSDAPGDGDGDE